MPIDLDKVLFEFSQNIKNVTEIAIKFEKQQIGAARLRHSEGLVTLVWIEVLDEFQDQGVGSKTLDAIVNWLVPHNTTFKIEAVDETILNKFYFQWFKSKSDPEKKYVDEVKDKFDELTSKDVFYVLEFTAEDLTWKAGAIKPSL